MTGSYGTPGHPSPDPKRPVTSMDAAADAAPDADASSPADPAAHGGPNLHDLPSTDTGVQGDEEASDSDADGGADSAR